jgi:hypothetical protein
MNYQAILLKALRKSYRIMNPDSSYFGRNWKMFSNKHYANELIYQTLIADQPCMISRIGSTESHCVTNYLGVTQPDRFRSTNKYIKEQAPPWWWEKDIINTMQLWSGFFPANVEYIQRFCKLFLTDMREIDVLGSWLKQEIFFDEQLKNSKKVVLEDLEPFFCTNPWTRALEGKKVLVVHPFTTTIESQYEKRHLLFENNLLPNFELTTVKAVQSVAGAETEFKDWFEALDSMKNKIDAEDYDIAIIGAGAYGLPLAAHVKRMGKKAVHLAGATQLLFGIKGKRWEEYIVWPYTNLFNEHWVRPASNEQPQNASKVEDACYW